MATNEVKRGRGRPRKDITMPRVITRKYTKKDGTVVTKTYIYKERQQNVKQTYTSRVTGITTVKYRNETKAHEQARLTGVKPKKVKIKTKKLFEGSNLTNKTKLINKTGFLRMEKIKELSRMTGVAENDIVQWVKSRFKKEGSISTVLSYTSFSSGNRVTEFLNNLKVDVDELVKAVNDSIRKTNKDDPNLDTLLIDESYVLSVNNWTKVNSYKIEDPLNLPNGQWIEFDWDYDLGSVFSIEGTPR